MISYQCLELTKICRFIPALEAVIKDVLAEANDAFGKAIDAQKKAADTVRDHNKQLKTAMEMSDDVSQIFC